jgi:tellurite resistance protein TerC
MYFLLADLMHRFIYLKIGLALVLVWVGIKMGLHDIWKVPTSLSLTVIIAILTVSIVASFVASKNNPAAKVVSEPKHAIPEASEAEIAALEKVFRKSARM